MNLSDERKLALGTICELSDLALQAVRDEYLTLADEHIDAAIGHGTKLRSDAVIGRNLALLEQARDAVAVADLERAEEYLSVIVG